MSRISSDIAASTSTRTTSPKRRAVELALDGLQQVVVALGDLEVGVARDAERRGLHDLHAGEEAPQVVGDHVLERDVAARRAPAAGSAAAPRAPSRARSGARPSAGRRPRRRATARGSRCTGTAGPGPTASGVSTGKICERERLGRLLALRGRALVERERCGCPRRPERGKSSPCRMRSSSASIERTRSEMARERPVGGRGRRRGRCRLSAWSSRPGDAHHEELVEVVGEDRAEPQPLQQRHARDRRELQHALVEVEPAKLAVGVELGSSVGGVPASRRGRGAATSPSGGHPRRGDEPDLLGPQQPAQLADTRPQRGHVDARDGPLRQYHVGAREVARRARTGRARGRRAPGRRHRTGRSPPRTRPRRSPGAAAGPAPAARPASPRSAAPSRALGAAATSPRALDARPCEPWPGRRAGSRYGPAPRASGPRRRAPASRGTRRWRDGRRRAA